MVLRRGRRRRSSAPASASSRTACGPTSTSATPGPSRIAPVDALFCGFWLSHVERDRHRRRSSPSPGAGSKPGGAFAFIDSLPDPPVRRGRPRPAPDRRPSVRRLADGREFTIVKVYREPAELEAALRDAGFATSAVTTTGRFFVLGSATRLRRSARCNASPGRDDPAVPYSAAMSPLANRTIATVGSGVMAEAMIAGLLRGALVEPDQVVASHPRAGAARPARAASTGSGSSPGNVEAIEGADVILLAIKPQMLGKVGREIGPQLRRGQLVLSVIAGATTTALIGTLGHDQVIRACRTRRPASARA